MIQLKRWLITLFCIIALVAGLGFIKFTQIQAAIAFGKSFPEPSETVNAMQASWSNFQPTVTVIGEVRAVQKVDVRNEIEGIVTKINFPSGGKVQKGDLLLQLNVDNEVAQLDAIKAEIDLAELDVKRFTDLLDVRASSREQLDRAKAQLAIAKARARAVQANIDKKTLIAPFTGYTSIHDWQVGTYLAANSMITTIIGDNNYHFVDFKLAQIYANMNVGDEVSIFADNATKTPMKAKIVAIDQELQNSSRTLQARAKLENPPKFLRPGVVVSVKVPTGDMINAMPLPNPAIRYDSFGSFVYALEKDENGDLRATRKPVTVVSKEADATYIKDGLEAGELVATIGSAKLNASMLTYVKAP